MEQHELQTLNDRLESLEKSVSQIRDAILGNEFNENAAYKARIEALEKFKSTVEIKLIKAQAWGMAIGFIACGLLELILKYSTIVSNLHTK